MAGTYVNLPDKDGEPRPVAENLVRIADLEQVDEELPNPQKMLEPLLLH